eukprot:6204744-Pleurochrysis_carterae.AAC.1
MHNRSTRKGEKIHGSRENELLDADNRARGAKTAKYATLSLKPRLSAQGCSHVRLKHDKMRRLTRAKLSVKTHRCERHGPPPPLLVRLATKQRNARFRQM